MHAGSKQEELLLDELAALDNQLIDINGTRFKPSDCYVVSTDPVRVSFHDHCPQLLRERIESVINRFKK
ncbi:hypothetical protein GWC95_08540 [Sediminibacterium roseum]|uniref:Uncharacterized protein n=1 Tax=Sediminibacterium roseum TaxID=1978412 RepID=A0ABW9ZS78_9BACT|nr:hypothetical protein [Sediminibacterium roseum]NCI49967.1 hypothetical protein [Sediminibacterium roseum]